jgi:hypothetical protein
VHGAQPSLDEAIQNVAAKTQDYGWRIVRKKSSGSVAAPIGAAMLALHLSKPMNEAKIYT